MASRFSKGQSVFFAFSKGVTSLDSQRHPRMYKSIAQAKKCPDKDIELVEYVPLAHGRWEPRKDAPGFVRCSVCRVCNVYDDIADGRKWKYCPECGAKMGVQKNGET